MINFFKNKQNNNQKIDYQLNNLDELNDFEKNFKKEKFQNSIYQDNYKFENYQKVLNINLKQDPIFDYEYTLYDYFLNFPNEIISFLLNKEELLQQKIYQKYDNFEKENKKLKNLNIFFFLIGIFSLFTYIKFEINSFLYVFYGSFWVFILFSLFLLFWKNNNFNQYSVLKNIITDIYLIIKENENEFKKEQKLNITLKQAENKIKNHLKDLEIFYLDKEKKLKIKKELNIFKKLVPVALILIFLQIASVFGIFILIYSIFKLLFIFTIKIDKNQWSNFFTKNENYIINSLYFNFFKNKNK